MTVYKTENIPNLVLQGVMYKELPYIFFFVCFFFIAYSATHHTIATWLNFDYYDYDIDYKIFLKTSAGFYLN